jgi:hypothetical protein
LNVVLAVGSKFGFIHCHHEDENRCNVNGDESNMEMATSTSNIVLQNIHIFSISGAESSGFVARDLVSQQASDSFC